MKINLKIICVITIIIVLLMLSLPIKAETIIYDTIITTQYKTITINDDLNYKLLTDYKYDVYINGNFAGKYSKDELIQIPDNSTILIYVPAPISLDYNSAWDLGKTYFAIAIMFLLTIGISIFVIIYFFNKSLRIRR